jgi:serine/threonine protein kinase
MISEGVTISHYKVLQSVGSGGMGEVYLAEDLNLGRKVALKVLLPGLANDEERVRRFEQEAKSASALNHPNILTVFEVGDFENTRYIATEFVSGQTLRDRMARGQMDLAEMFAVTLQVTAALCAAHEAGIVHRDIKPENIMIRDDGLVKVLDFGLAKLITTSVASGDTTLPQIDTHPGMLIGTVAYMSPEQARGQKLDPRSDIFSLGIVMFELFAGRRPFSGDGHLDLISSILKDDPPALRQVSPDLPRQLERIVDKALRKDRENRYQHVKDLQIDLQDLRDELSFEDKLKRSSDRTEITPVLTTGADLKQTLTGSISRTRRFTILHALLIAAVAAVLVSGAWYVRSKMNPPASVPGSYKITEIASWNSAPGELFSNASFSPDGKLIAFASTKSGTKNIWVTQTASTEAIQITNDGFSNIDPIWSPKGDEIAYYSDQSNSAGQNLTGIWRISALGGKPRLIGQLLDKRIEMRRWTQSGMLYYQLLSDLYAMDSSNGQSQKITSFNDPNITWVNISPDEKSVAYATKSTEQWHIYVNQTSQEKTIEAASGVGSVANIVWLPEINRIFFGSTVAGIEQVFESECGSGKNIQITSTSTDNNIVDVSSDGRSVICNSTKEESNLWRVKIIDGQESTLSRDLNANLWPAVSPDSERLAFQSVRNSNGGDKIFDSDIVTIPIKGFDGGERPTRLTSRGFLPSWSPNNSELAFLRLNGESAELYSVNPSGGGERLLTKGPIPLLGYSTSPYNYTQATVFAWSPDSTRIAYASDRNGTSNIWIVVPGDLSDRVLTENYDKDTFFSCPIWASDGKRLAFYFQKKTGPDNKMIRGLKVVDSTTGNVSTMLETSWFIHLIGWTPDEKGLVFAASEKFSGLPPETYLKQITPAGETTVTQLKNAYFYNLFQSPDRKTIAYAARTMEKDDVWIVSASGGAARRITNNNDQGLYVSRLTWLGDGSAIVFAKQARFSLLSLITDFNWTWRGYGN